MEFEKRHKAATLFALALAAAATLYASGSIESFAHGLGQYEYAGAFFAGMLFSEGLTTPFGIAAFLTLAKDLNPFLMAAIGATGALCGDLLIYKLFSSQAGRRLKISQNESVKIPEIKNRFLKKISPLLAGIVLASPLPDELAMGLLGLEHYETKKFIAIAFAAKFAAILAIGLAVRGA